MANCTIRPSLDVSLFNCAAVLVGSRRGTRVLHDEDSTSLVVKSRKRLNTLAHYKVPDGASLALQSRQLLYATSAKNGTVKQHNGTCFVMFLSSYLCVPNWSKFYKFVGAVSEFHYFTGNWRLICCKLTTILNLAFTLDLTLTRTLNPKQ